MLPYVWPCAIAYEPCTPSHESCTLTHETSMEDVPGASAHEFGKNVVLAPG